MLQCLIAALAGLDASQVNIVASLSQAPQRVVTLVVNSIEIHLPLAEVVDEQAERQRLQKELAQVESQIARLEALLAGDFARKAPAAMVQKERKKLETFQETAEKLRAKLA